MTAMQSSHPRWLRIGILLIVLIALCAFVLMWRPEIKAVSQRPQFSADQIARGARVAEAGDCAVCHTAPGGKYLAGGLALVTPFGTLYSTNITPDPQTGIGTWSLPAFERAMRKGVSRDGHFLYPAFPYVHYSRMTDSDIADAYAYLMSGPAVDAPAKQNRMIFPMSIRPLVSTWNLLFLHTDPLVPVPQQSESWNRGRYLVEGPGHCASCHSPLNLLGAEKSGQSLHGGIVDGWEAPALVGMANAIRPWSADQLVAYLRAQVVPEHGTAAGPMRPVSLGLANLPVDDVKAIAQYLLSLESKAPSISATSPERPEKEVDRSSTARLFEGACAACHASSAPMRVVDGRPALDQTSSLHAGSPRNFLKTVLDGLPFLPGKPGPYMPAFADSLNNDQIVALATMLREQAKPGQTWSDTSTLLQDLRQEAK